VTELARKSLVGIEQTLSPAAEARASHTPSIATRPDSYDIGSLILVAALIALVLLTFREYAVTNDEWIQHRYGQLIIAYYKSGFSDRSVFELSNLYLYGGLFDLIAALLSSNVPVDTFELRHLMSALAGVGGVGAAIGIARMIGGPRAGLFAGAALAVCGSWYGTMFHHTKDIPLAAAMAGATYFLMRAARELPRPRLHNVICFGVLTGAALGIKVLGLLLIVYLGIAILLHVPIWKGREAGSFILTSSISFIPSLLIAYAIMIVAWPWSALAPLNPIRGLFSFGDFHYNIRTVLDGTIYQMATVPRYYVPLYIGIRIPLLILAGAMLGILLATVPAIMAPRRRSETAMMAVILAFPILCEVVARGPAFSGLRHFLFVLPPLAVVAGIGFDAAISQASQWKKPFGTMSGFAILGIVTAGFFFNAVTLYRLHPYEYLAYNSLVGGLEGAARRYVTDYWATMMPEAVEGLETFLMRTEPLESRDPNHSYTVAFCGERASFLKKAAPHLHWAQVWETADFLIVPTHMNCDYNSRAKIVATVQRMDVPIGYVKDQRPARN
jgi:hypothetical protein